MNVMRSLPTRNALCTALLVMTALPAWAQPEELWLDSQGGAVSSQTVLDKDKPYSLTIKGTYSVWRTLSPAGAKSGKAEPSPMFASPKGANKEVGLDPEFVFAWPQGSRQESSSAPSPRRLSTIEVSLDGGKTWTHPASTAAFDAAEHEYAYALTGIGNALQVRLVDSPAADNYGRLRLSVQPAEELWLDSQSGTPLRSETVLKKGKPYRITMKGTYTVWKTLAPLGTKSGKAEPAPQFASPKGAAKEAGWDPEFLFAWPKSSGQEKSSDPSPRRLSTLEVSLDGGKTWKHPSSTAAFNATDHEYTYALSGEDSALQVRLVDNLYGDNSGRVRIYVQPGT